MMRLRGGLVMAASGIPMALQPAVVSLTTHLRTYAFEESVFTKCSPMRRGTSVSVFRDRGSQTTSGHPHAGGGQCSRT